MQLIISKKSQSPIVWAGEKEKPLEYAFGVEASSITSKEDVQEVIRQCELMKEWLPDENPIHPSGMISGGFHFQCDELCAIKKEEATEG